MPAAVVLARETEHVQHALRVASALRVPVVPQGARSGLSGAANAIDGCIVRQHREDATASSRSTRRTGSSSRSPASTTPSSPGPSPSTGSFYPPDPSSWEFCSIGGNLATNSGGLCCVKYGVTTDYVLGLEVVLASGEVLRTGRRTVKGVAGYDLTRLFVGSEGTLGVITEATLALRPGRREAAHGRRAVRDGAGRRRRRRRVVAPGPSRASSRSWTGRRCGRAAPTSGRTCRRTAGPC